jgi:hypothetical protein
MRFVRHVLPLINHPFVLVTGSADFSAPFLSGTEGALGPATSILTSPHLVAWFAQNPDVIHPKLIPVPIGIDFHTLAVPNMTEHSWGTPTSVAAQDALLQELRCTLPPFHARPPVAIMNFKAAGRDVRSYVFNLLKDRPGVRTVGGLSRASLWRLYGGVSFVLSPRGYGKDCHRTWEALTLGCAVIVSRDIHLDPLYADLPVIQVEDWGAVTAEALAAWHADLSARWHTFRWEKLRAAFWLDAVRAAARDGHVDAVWKAYAVRNADDAWSRAEFTYGA